MQIKTKIASSHTADSKPVNQEVNGIVILPPLIFLVKGSSSVAAAGTEKKNCERTYFKMIQQGDKNYCLLNKNLKGIFVQSHFSSERFFLKVPGN